MSTSLLRLSCKRLLINLYSTVELSASIDSTCPARSALNVLCGFDVLRQMTINVSLDQQNISKVQTEIKLVTVQHKNFSIFAIQTLHLDSFKPFGKISIVLSVLGGLFYIRPNSYSH